MQLIAQAACCLPNRRYANSPTIVQWKATVKGTGALMTASFESNTKLSKIKSLKIEPLNDAGFSGPAGPYLKGGAL